MNTSHSVSVLTQNSEEKIKFRLILTQILNLDIDFSALNRYWIQFYLKCSLPVFHLFTPQIVKADMTKLFALFEELVLQFNQVIRILDKFPHFWDDSGKIYFYKVKILLIARSKLFHHQSGY